MPRAFSYRAKSVDLSFCSTFYLLEGTGDFQANLMCWTRNTIAFLSCKRKVVAAQEWLVYGSHVLRPPCKIRGLGALTTESPI